MSSTTVYTVASEDDARQAVDGGAGILTDNYQLLTNSDNHVGERFILNIPQGSTINDATFYGYFYNTSYDTGTYTVAGEDADTAAAFTTAVGDISNRTLTTATAAASYTDAMTGGEGYYEIADVTTIIQEIVNRVGWSSGNYAALISHTLTAGDVRYRSYDYNPAQAPKLVVDYTEPAGITMAAMYYARHRG